jgi:hypothetical protein
MKIKSLLNLKKSLLHAGLLPLLVVFMVLGTSLSANAQKYEVTGSPSQIDQATDIKLSGSTVGKFYYLFKIDEQGEYQFITYMVGQSYELNYAPQKAAGKYVVYEFDEYKGMPFNFGLYKPADGILQTGEVTITANQN